MDRDTVSTREGAHVAEVALRISAAQSCFVRSTGTGCFFFLKKVLPMSFGSSGRMRSSAQKRSNLKGEGTVESVKERRLGWSEKRAQSATSSKVDKDDSGRGRARAA